MSTVQSLLEEALVWVDLTVIVKFYLSTNYILLSSEGRVIFIMSIQYLYTVYIFDL